MVMRMNPEHETPNPSEWVRQIRGALASERPIALVRGVDWAANPAVTTPMSQYVREYGPSYRNVFWLRADRRSLFRSEFAQLAIRVGVSGGHALDLATMTEYTRAWLAHERDWLLVVDGVSDSVDLVLQSVDKLPGHVIVAGVGFDCPPSIECIDTESPPSDGAQRVTEWVTHPLVAVATRGLPRRARRTRPGPFAVGRRPARRPGEASRCADALGRPGLRIVAFD
jgi:hypothetical protein